MLKIERVVIDWADRHKVRIFVVAVSILALMMRIYTKDSQSADYYWILRIWYDEIVENGRLAAIGTQVGDYNVAYQFIVALLSYLPISSLVLYKGLSIVFDYLLAFAVGLLTFELKQRTNRLYFVLGYTMTLILPTVFINSAVWAQCDSIYVFFCVMCIYCLIGEKTRRKTILGFVSLGLAFAMKLQAIFILPFLCYHYIIEKKHSLIYLIIPVGINVIIPMLCGRGPLETVRIYLTQSDEYHNMTMNIGNLWSIITEGYDMMHKSAVILTVLILGIALLALLYRKDFFMKNRLMILLWTIWTCVMFLPAMHDRYAYMLEVLFIVAVLMDIRLWPYAFVAEVATLLHYSGYLWNLPLENDLSIYIAVAYFAGYACFTAKLIYMGAATPVTLEE